MPKNDLQNYLLTYAGHFSGVFFWQKRNRFKVFRTGWVAC